MKPINILFLAAWLVWYTPVIHAQSKTRTMNNTSALTDEQQLQQLNASFIRNFINEDTTSHNEIIHKNFICIESNGVIVDRDTYMKEWASGYSSGQLTSFIYTDELIRIFGNMALVRSRTDYVKQSGAKGSSVYTDTYIKENGRWWCVQAQITAIIAK
jgi:hypothetical protein